MLEHNLLAWILEKQTRAVQLLVHVQNDVIQFNNVI